MTRICLKRRQNHLTNAWKIAPTTPPVCAGAGRPVGQLCRGERYSRRFLGCSPEPPLPALVSVGPGGST